MPTNPHKQEKLIRELDLNLLRTFMFIAQEGSITLAAKRLMRRQPSVSQALQRLEAQLGIALIDRSPSHFRITPAGQILYHECQELFGNLVRTIENSQGTKDVVTGKVKLALLSGVVSDFFDGVLADFHRENRQVSFDLEVMSSTKVQQAVLDKSVGLGVCIMHDPHPNLQYDLLYRSYFGFFCGAGHPLFGQHNLTLEDMRDHSSVSFRTDQLWDALRPVALLRAQHKLDNKVIGYTSNLTEAQRMITAGLGFGPLPVHVAAHLVAQGRLWRLPPYGNEMIVDVHLVHHKSARMNRAELALLEMFQHRIAALPLAQRTYDLQDV
ncbi:LysR family transcriptional regulator [uncultured Sulfitobacter sp.]|uniref:LysR family transcriptional regulator n=1 Tax=uncultured Sulfitobacter sp. TaxID=191468 RepID=UPI002613D9EF|nr:LysR family transcriptional regulator [uncultured Sulfitobacter sp.]